MYLKRSTKLSDVTLKIYSKYHINSRFLDFFAFLCPTLLFIEFNLIGRVRLPEILLIAILPLLLLMKGRLLFKPWPRTVLILGILWLVSQIITDLIRITPFQDLARGWSKISFFLLCFSSLYLLLVNNKKRILLSFIGSAIGGILFFYTHPMYQDGYSQLRFTYTILVFNIIVLVSLWQRFAKFPVLIMLLFATGSVIVMYMDSRSAGGLLILSAIYLYLHYNPKLRYIVKKQLLSLPRIVFLMTISALLVWAIIIFYSIAADSGWLGEDAQKKYQTQNISGYGILLGGRSEILVSSQAIMDSPIIGHGSWSKELEYFELNISILETIGKISSEAARTMLMQEEVPVIASHSHIFGSWVEAGVLGALFWFWMLILVIRMLYGLFQVKHFLLPLFVVNGISLLWNIPFSPLSFRSQEAFGIVLVLIALQFIQDSLKKEKRRKLPKFHSFRFNSISSKFVVNNNLKKYFL
jgi:hypothetical protein